jgi:hypothetical protein
MRPDPPSNGSADPRIRPATGRRFIGLTARTITTALVAVTFAILSTESPAAWGLDIHRRITALALDGLPAPLRQFYARERAFVVEHSVDPDMWRVVALRTELGAEDPNHFLDIDDLDEPEPWTGVPRDWKAFLSRYGEQRATRAGRLPWRTTEVYELLVAAWKSHASGKAPYAAGNARYLSAVIAHYIEDGNQPFHAVANYDGQLTNQRGVHSRFETELAQRYWTRVTHPRVVVTPIPDIKTFVFDRVTEGARLSRQILDADRKAATVKNAAGQFVYDDAYYARFFQGARSVLETRLASSANAVASVWVQAWTDAGKPAVN